MAHTRTHTEEQHVRVRIAPSPTGPVTLGTARTALFNWLFARKHKGAFIVRIEDTDRERSKPEYEKNILEGLAWLGLTWDEGPVRPATSYQLPATSFGDYGPYRQSERTDIYKKYLKQLLEEGKAYWCYCTKEELEAEQQALKAEGLPPKYGGHCRDIVAPPRGKKLQTIRLKTPLIEVAFKDLIRGQVKFDASLLGDMIIATDLDRALYNVAVVIDDELMKISHVIRGEDHISNTPKQILLQSAFGFGEPIYAHLPLILSPDRSKLSKRTAETSLLEYRRKGYLAEAVLNFLVLLGWHPKGDDEVFTPEELIKIFDIKRVQKSGAAFNEEKLDWLNREHMKKLSNEEIVECLEPILKEAHIKAEPEFVKRVLTVLRERMKTLRDFITLSHFFFSLPEYDATLLIWQDDDAARTETILEAELAVVTEIPIGSFGGQALVSGLAPLIEQYGRGSVYWPLRVAVSGAKGSPDPILICDILGKDETVRRITIALGKLGLAL